MSHKHHNEHQHAPTERWQIKDEARSVRVSFVADQAIIENDEGHTLAVPRRWFTIFYEPTLNRLQQSFYDSQTNSRHKHIHSDRDIRRVSFE